MNRKGAESAEEKSGKNSGFSPRRLLCGRLIKRKMMSKEHFRFVVKRLLLIEAAVIAGVAVLCLLAGWHSVNEIAMAYLVIGVLIFAIGPFSMMGGWGTTRNFTYLYGRSMDESSHLDRLHQDQDEIGRSIGLVIPSVILGTITMVLAVVFQTIFS